MDPSSSTCHSWICSAIATHIDTQTTKFESNRAKKAEQHAKRVEELVEAHLKRMARFEEAALGKVECDQAMLDSLGFLNNQSDDNTINMLCQVVENRTHHLREGKSEPISPSLIHDVLGLCSTTWLNSVVAANSGVATARELPCVVMRLKPHVRRNFKHMNLRPSFTGNLHTNLLTNPCPVPLPDRLTDWYNVSAVDQRNMDGVDVPGMEEFHYYIRELTLSNPEFDQVVEKYRQKFPGDSPYAAMLVRKHEMDLQREISKVNNNTRGSNNTHTLFYGGVSRKCDGMERMTADMNSKTTQVRAVNFIKQVGLVRAGLERMDVDETSTVDPEESTTDNNYDSPDMDELDASGFAEIMDYLNAVTVIRVEVPSWGGLYPELVLDFVSEIEDLLIILLGPTALNSGIGGYIRQLTLGLDVEDAIASVGKVMSQYIQEVEQERVKPAHRAADESMKERLQRVYYDDENGFSAIFNLGEDPRNHVNFTLTQISDPISTVKGRVPTIHIFKDITLRSFDGQVPFFHPHSGPGPLVTRDLALRVHTPVLTTMVENARPAYTVNVALGPFVDVLPTKDRGCYYVPLWFLREQLSTIRPIHITANSEAVTTIFLHGLLGDPMLDERAIEERFGYEPAKRRRGEDGNRNIPPQKIGSLKYKQCMFELAGKTYVAKTGSGPRDWCIISPNIHPGFFKHDPIFAWTYYQVYALCILNSALLSVYVRWRLAREMRSDDFDSEDTRFHSSVLDDGSEDQVTEFLDLLIRDFEKLDAVIDIQGKLEVHRRVLRDHACLVKSLRLSGAHLAKRKSVPLAPKPSKPLTASSEVTSRNLPTLTEGAPRSETQETQMQQFLAVLKSYPRSNDQPIVPSSFPCPRNMLPGSAQWVEWARGLEEGKAYRRCATGTGNTARTGQTQEEYWEEIRRKRTATAGASSTPDSLRYSTFLLNALAAIVKPGYVVRPTLDKVYRLYICNVADCVTRSYVQTPQPSGKAPITHSCAARTKRACDDLSYNYVRYAHDVPDFFEMMDEIQKDIRFRTFGVRTAQEVFPAHSEDYKSLPSEVQALVDKFHFATVITNLEPDSDASQAWKEFDQEQVIDRLLKLYRSSGPPSIVLAEATPTEEDVLGGSQPSFLNSCVELRKDRQILSVSEVIGNPKMEWCGRKSDSSHRDSKQQPKQEVKQVERNVWNLPADIRAELFAVYVNNLDKMHKKQNKRHPLQPRNEDVNAG
ncbi:hypothetical protein HDU93_008896 [Gonapodya sp. JEL0774]|nr:hypothetical protein HDU93_008896 [Gonapodya sp. JEL0774]